MNMAKQKAISDEEIIAALIASGTIAAAAEAAGISPRTIYERMRNREFKAAYRAAKSDLIRSAVFNIDARLTEAIDTIAEIMSDKQANPAIRLQAAQTILNNAQKFADRLKGEESSIAAATEKPFEFEF